MPNANHFLAFNCTVSALNSGRPSVDGRRLFWVQPQLSESRIPTHFTRKTDSFALCQSCRTQHYWSLLSRSSNPRRNSWKCETERSLARIIPEISQNSCHATMLPNPHFHYRHSQRSLRFLRWVFPRFCPDYDWLIWSLARERLPGV